MLTSCGRVNVNDASGVIRTRALVGTKRRARARYQIDIIQSIRIIMSPALTVVINFKSSYVNLSTTCARVGDVQVPLMRAHTHTLIHIFYLGFELRLIADRDLGVRNKKKQKNISAIRIRTRINRIAFIGVLLTLL